MRTVGIVMECNPFHEGHRYIIGKAREAAAGGPVIVVMSGDFVQRGIPAVQPKELRTGQVLGAGASMVLELPVRDSTSSAEGFAAGAVSLLNDTGIVTDLVFGSESGDLDEMQRQARFLSDEPEEYRYLLKEHLREGLTFPAARAAAAAACPQHVLLPDTPNDLLGEEYLKALLRTRSRIVPHAVSRISAPSASDIRAEMKQNGEGIFADDFSGVLLEKLLLCCQEAPDLPGSDSSLQGQALPSRQRTGPDAYEGVTADLANRIRRLLPCYVSWEQFAGLLKNRSITSTAVSRALVHILLDIRKENVPPAPWQADTFLPADAPECRRCVRVLGARREDLPLIARMEERNARLSVITGRASWNKAVSSGLSSSAAAHCLQDRNASELYDLVLRMKQNLSGRDTSENEKSGKSRNTGSGTAGSEDRLSGSIRKGAENTDEGVKPVSEWSKPLILL